LTINKKFTSKVLIMDKRIKGLWNSGQAIVCGWLLLPDSLTAEIMANQGYDIVTIDLQHGLIDYQTAVSMLQAMNGSSTVPFARVPWLDPAIIMKLLDAGILGIICPMINTADEARRLASYVRYPPVGERSFGPARAGFIVDPDYGGKANDMVKCLAMIETAEGYRNVEEIVQVEGIDGVYIGPIDLTLGLYGNDLPIGIDREEPEMIEAIKKILNSAHAAGKKAGIHCGTPEYAARMTDLGFDMVALSTDLSLFSAASKSSLEATRRLMSGDSTESGQSTPSGNFLSSAR
jgi:4-hydroxy-2-oxoheptanedioate aldolase